MTLFTRGIVFIAMILLGIVSMWITYVSLTDSILPVPRVPISLWEGQVWSCSIFALGLSVALGLMLFALKIAIIDGQKRLTFFGVIGMTLVAFISIAFNIDVLYRMADREFFMKPELLRRRSFPSPHVPRERDG